MSTTGATHEQRPLRVAFCHYAADVFGGSDRALYDLVTHLPRDRFAPHMLLRHGDPMITRYREHGIPVETFHLVPPRRAIEWGKLVRFALHFLPASLRLAAAIRRMNADVVHVNTLFNMQGAFAARLSGRPLVWHVRELIPDSRVFGWMTRLVARWSTRAIAISEAVAAVLARCGNRLRTVLNSVDPHLFENLPPRSQTRAEWHIALDAPVVLCAGRLEHWKGQHVLIEAVPAILAAHPEAVVLVAGAAAVNKPGYLTGLQERCAALDIQARVRFLGRREDVPALMAAADVLVLPSVTPEPFGLTVIEAMAAGCPVVATRAGGPLDSVIDGETGLLAAPGAPEDLAEKVNQVLSAPERARAMGAAGRERVYAHFTIDREVAEIAAILEQAAESRSGRPATTR
ncbi:MAG: glycosyltransferase family 4 protein [Candidatus Hydrogenedentota bacterium]